jgi:Spy/CpxP family protein refolding chaperone
MKTTRTKATMWLLALGFGLAIPVVALAQPGGNGGDEQGEFDGRRGKRHERLKVMHARVLKEKVGLDDARIARIQAVHEQFRGQGKALREDLKAARESLRLLVESDSNDTKAYEKALDAAKTARDRMHALRMAQQAEVAKLLSAKEQAKLVLTMDKVHKHKGKRGFGGRGGKGKGEWRGHRGGPGPGPGFGPDVDDD